MISIIFKMLLFAAWIVVTLFIKTPAVSIKNPAFIAWLCITVVIFLTLFVIKNSSRNFTLRSGDGGAKVIALPKIIHKSTFVVMGLFFVYMVIGTISSSVMLRSDQYASQLEYETSTIEEFATVVPAEEVATNNLPLIDEEMAIKLAEGCLGKYGSQYKLGTESNALIHVNTPEGERLVRVFPLEYSDTFVALTHINEGSAGYVVVDVVTSETKLVEVDGGIQYMETGLAFKDIDRYVWMHYPTLMTTDYSFELDDEGNPYWVASYYDKEIGLFGGKEPKGVVVVDAVTGDIEKYPMGEEPKWVDRVVPVEIAYQQADMALTYKNGWINARFGAKEEVYNLSGQYNFMMIDGKTYMYAGITSPNATDETSVGFMLIDLKTKEATMYPITGITEERAMEIAKNHQSVKAQNLTPTSPILVNMDGVPTYFLTLKNGYQVQWYCFVKVSDGSIVLNQDLTAAKTEYLSMVSDEAIVAEDEMLSKTGQVLRVNENTEEDLMEFVFVDDPEKMYSVPMSEGTSAKFMQPGDTVTIKYVETGDGDALVKEITNETLLGSNNSQ